ncbi:cdkn1a interacting zinc finger protein 1b isoform X2 [Halichoeres trimaculatus]|uniref:cdkn1a interacting zinc finger protein 1b isoform X2 n=1 Tax=Halichoeres trimaculatus TaxID=147232 RepID=UPI003D9F5002
MVKQQRRTDRCLIPSVRFPVDPTWRRHPTTPQASGKSSMGSEEGKRAEGGSGESETKRARLKGPEEAAALINEDRLLKSYIAAGSESGSSSDGVTVRTAIPDQQGAAALSEDSRAAELQSVASLKVTIQQSSESREFGQTDRTTDRQTGGFHCHVCNVTCRSVQVFQEHMMTPEHLKKMNEITHSISVNTHTLQDRGHRPDTQRWCDTCQTHFTSDVILHRRTKEHKMCKQMCRPFCPVCKRHFRTPRKFVEHMKSAEHKQQVQLEAPQEEELIIVDAVGCFEEEEEDEEEGEEEEEEVDVEEEDGERKDEKKEETMELKSSHLLCEKDLKKQNTTRLPVCVSQETDTEEYDPHTTCGDSFIVPVSGFLCRLCNKFFHRETTARHTHCRTHTHYLNVQSHRAQKKQEEEERSALT